MRTTPAAQIEPFTIAVSDADLQELRDRLAHARWDDLDHDGLWDTPSGVSPEVVRQLAARWQNEFDWRAVEQQLNTVPQSIVYTPMGPLHTVHVRSPRSDATPLLLLHGWPSTFAEYRHVIGVFTNPDDATEPAFHVVLPSLPGFGFSPRRTGAGNSVDMAADLIALMRALGYDRYLVHGSDLGQAVAEQLAVQAPQTVRGLHLHVGGVRLASLHAAETPSTAGEAEALRRLQLFTNDKSGYATLNRTRPDTLAYGLTDSPVGQLAWIAEKYLEWADPNHPVSEDDILLAASIYWFTRTAGSSARFYWAEFRRIPKAVDVVRVPVAGVAFQHDIVPAIRRWAKELLPITQWTESDHGGHFAALETPNVMVDSIRRFARTLQRNEF